MPRGELEPALPRPLWVVRAWSGDALSAGDAAAGGGGGFALGLSQLPPEPRGVLGGGRGVERCLQGGGVVFEALLARVHVLLGAGAQRIVIRPAAAALNFLGLGCVLGE